MIHFVSPFLFLSLLSDSNQRPRDYKSRALANCDQALEDSKGAGRIGLTRFRFAVAKVDIILESAIACGGFFICFFRFSILSLFMAFLYRHFGGEVRILSGITMDKYSSY